MSVITLVMNYLLISDAEIQTEIGQRLRQARLNINISQAKLAEIAGLARRTITNTESGQGCSLLTLIAILRGLNLLSQLETFIPDPGLSPIQLAKLRGKQRRRASGTRSN